MEDRDSRRGQSKQPGRLKEHRQGEGDAGAAQVVKLGDTVRVRYTGRLKRDGSIFDSNEGGSPLQIKVGEGRTLWSFEDAILGMTAGQRKQVEIPSRKAFGEPLKHQVRFLSKGDLPPGREVRPGQRLRVTLEDGHQAVVKVMRVTGESILVDANHPLAGEDLVFDIELLEII
jgi:peptidylprolyl isomerase